LPDLLKLLPQKAHRLRRANKWRNPNKSDTLKNAEVAF
jgi:hypothetical protein